MILEFIGNAPKNNFLRLGVSGNNLVDDLVFIISRKQGKNDLYDFTPKIKITTAERDFAEYSGDDLTVEKIEERDTIKITYELPEIVTEHGNIDMLIVFEKAIDGGVVKKWQTLPFNITFPDGIDESESLIKAYPNIVQELKDNTKKAIEDSKEAVSTAKAVYEETKALEGTKAPTRHTVGSLGQRYRDTITGKTYLCVEIREAVMPGFGTIYGWMPLFVPNNKYDDFRTLYLPIGQSVIVGGEHHYVAGRESNDSEYFYVITAVLANLTDKNGNPTSNIHYSISADADTLPLRDSNGNIKVGAPVEDGDATPKSYVDGKVDDSTTDTEHAWSGSKVNNALNGLAQGMSGMGDGLTQAINGKLDKVSTTSSSNRLYGVSPSGEQKVFTGSYIPASGTVPLYSGAGNLRVNSPSENTHCVNKQYVDALKQSTNPNTANTAGHIGQLCLVGSTDFDPYDVYICVHDSDGMYVWHKMCTTEATA